MVVQEISFEDMMDKMKDPKGLIHLISNRDNVEGIMDELRPIIDRKELFRRPILNIFFGAVGEAYHNAIRHGHRYDPFLCSSVKIWRDKLGNYLARICDSGEGFNHMNPIKKMGGFAMYEDPGIVTSFENNGSTVNIQLMASPNIHKDTPGLDY